MNGTSYPFRGQLNPSGAAAVAVLRHGLPPTALGFHLDTPRPLLGFVTNAVGTNILVSKLYAERQTFGAQNTSRSQLTLEEFSLRTISDNTSVGAGYIFITGSGSIRIHGRARPGSSRPSRLGWQIASISEMRGSSPRITWSGWLNSTGFRCICSCPGVRALLSANVRSTHRAVSVSGSAPMNRRLTAAHVATCRLSRMCSSSAAPDLALNRFAGIFLPTPMRFSLAPLSAWSNVRVTASCGMPAASAWAIVPIPP